MTGTTQALPLHLREFRKESREADFVASTDAVDSYGEVVAQNWDLTRFNGNPVILFAHRSRELPIGKAKNTRVEDGKLQLTVVFASEKANPLAEQVFQSVSEGTLRAVSVGFNPRTIRFEKRDEKEIVVLDDNELFEVSVTPIPANPEALAKMKAKALAEAESSPPKRGDETTKEVNGMTIEQKDLDALEAKVAERDAKIVEQQSALSAETAKAKALEAQNVKLAEERDAAVKRANELDAKSIEAKVDALVGVKFTPAERDDQVEFAKSNLELWQKLADQRANLELTESKSVMGSDPDTVERDASDEDGDDFDQAAEKV